MSASRKRSPKISWSVGLTLVAIVLAAGGWWVLTYPKVVVWLIATTLVTATAFWFDKSSAQRWDDPRRRVPEFSLLWMCAIGGSLGGVLVMLGRNHKTMDTRFKLWIMLIVGIQMGALGVFVAQRIAGS